MKFSNARGQKSFEDADKLIRTEEYKNMSAEDKQKALKKCYDAAGETAKKEILKGRGIEAEEKKRKQQARKRKNPIGIR